MQRLHREPGRHLAAGIRSRPLTDIASQSQAFVAALIDTAEQDRRRLESAVEDLLQQATVLPTEPAVVTQARAAEILWDLKTQSSS